MTMKPSRLPSPLTKIVVPDEFHPSSFAQLEHCPLSVLGLLGANVDDLLVSHPAVFLGMVLHHVRHEVLEGRWAEAGDPRQAALEVFNETVEEAEAALRSDDATAGLVPLRESLGRRDWRSRTRDLERWAANVTTSGTNELARPLRIRRRPPSAAPSEPAHVKTGSEKILVNPDLRLRGRPDLSAHVDEESIEVVDFKSGWITDVDGQLLDEYVVQVQLYALMLEAAFPGTRVTPFLERIERVEVPWGERERVRVTERLREAASALPAGASLKSRDLARPGVHCRACRLRPMCPAYLDTAPTWWPDSRGNPRPMPLDVWGEIVSIQAEDEGVSVRLIDVAGRRVRVDGISRSHGVEVLSDGDTVWFFDLEASEDLSQHGALVQPRNFHERPPSPRWRRARRVRVFCPG